MPYAWIYTRNKMPSHGGQFRNFLLLKLVCPWCIDLTSSDVWGGNANNRCVT